ncbi:hypothetical protein EYF80_005752 [Liparis tanakae]|uniref:Uncharacterized protein n=1 Tax=Liparis tanakae TaxID=230148 RepID=A0A4Z2J1M9_9TELE|nr:hypothetical protein EYF80_005752 [Liparis tanakae]
MSEKTKERKIRVATQWKYTRSEQRDELKTEQRENSLQWTEGELQQGAAADAVRLPRLPSSSSSVVSSSLEQMLNTFTSISREHSGLKSILESTFQRTERKHQIRLWSRSITSRHPAPDRHLERPRGLGSVAYHGASPPDGPSHMSLARGALTTKHSA